VTLIFAEAPPEEPPDILQLFSLNFDGFNLPAALPAGFFFYHRYDQTDFINILFTNRVYRLTTLAIINVNAFDIYDTFVGEICSLIFLPEY